MDSKRFLYILNPVSGNGDERENVIEMINELMPDIKLEEFETTGKNDVEKIKKIISENQDYDGILIGGGDGTVKMVVEVLIGSDAPIGIIPLGSANGLAKCLGISNITESIHAISTSKMKSMDYLDINGEICLHLSDFGFNAGLVKKFDEDDGRGMVTYFKSTLRQFFDMQPYRFEITTDGKTETVEAKMLVIANGDKYGTGASINPTGKMDDGLMEIIALNPQGFDEIASLSIAMFRGTLDESDLVKTWKVKQAEIRNLDAADFQIDGEVIPNTSSVKATCKHDQFKFFIYEPPEEEEILS